MIYVIDIDNTISITEGVNYEDAKPNQKIIDYINKLYDEGHRIIIYTARGTTSKINWRKLTEWQLKKWKVKYHELKFGKIIYDFWIDDRAINPKDLKI